jgi:peptide/nickel transport system substrate-binding protein
MAWRKEAAVETSRPVPSRRDFLKVSGAALAGGAVLVGCGSSTSPAPAAKGAIKKGGTFRVGLIGGSGSSETLDPNGLTPSDLAVYRIQNVFSKLTDMDHTGNYVPQLAESLEPNGDASEWVVKIKPGVQWHDGSDVTADDVIYSFQRVLNPKYKATLGAAAGDIPMVNPTGMTKLDKYTVKFRLLYPWVAFPAQVGQRYNAIIKAGTTHFTVSNFIGTGPFMLKQWSPGQSFLLTKNPNYFMPGKPYVDEVHGISIVDDSARLDALLGNQVDAIEQVSISDAKVIKGRGMVLLVSPAGPWDPIVMDTSRGPFKDPRVRLAMKLVADRAQMLESALQGYGTIGNDLFGVHDPLYDHSIPQRQHDPAQAMSLLKKAGYADYPFVLNTAAVVPDFVPSALVFQQNAKAAGMNMTVRTNSADSYWGSIYGHEEFFYSSWGYRTFFPQWDQAYVSYNSSETNWTDAKAKQASGLVKSAAATTDLSTQRRLTGQAQELEWTDGGYIIWAYKEVLDGLNPHVHGILPNPFSSLGWLPWDSVWIS